ncbi:MAG TPA: AI-2E family transporter [Gammaproteobacteria bacterium]|nr:AI-2E family transporter [Gammaproteobacteria bacterium]
MESLTTSSSWSKPFIVFLVVVFAGLLYLLAPILTPFLFGALLAYLVNPLVNQLTQFHLSRLLSVIIVFFLLFLIVGLMVFLFIPLLEDQITNLAGVISNTVDWIQNTAVPWIILHTRSQDTFNMGNLKDSLVDNWSKAGGVMTWLWKTVLHSGLAFAAWITNLILIPVVTFYLLRDWSKIIKNTRDLLPRQIESTVVQLVTECDSVLSAFFRGQFLVMIALGIIYSIGLTFVGLQVGLIIGLVSGLVSIVPYLGFIVGVTAASIAAFIQFGTLTAVLSVIIVFLVGQMLESMVLTPKLVGDRIGLHPVAVIFAILVGASLFGFFGVLLALPVAAVIMVWLRFLNQRYRASPLYR